MKTQKGKTWEQRLGAGDTITSDHDALEHQMEIYRARSSASQARHLDDLWRDWFRWQYIQLKIENVDVAATFEYEPWWYGFIRQPRI